MLYPKKNVNLENVVDYLNSDEFKENFLFSGRFKIGQRQAETLRFPLCGNKFLNRVHKRIHKTSQNKRTEQHIWFIAIYSVRDATFKHN